MWTIRGIIHVQKTLSSRDPLIRGDIFSGEFSCGVFCHLTCKCPLTMYGSPLLPSRFRVPAYLKRARKRGDEKTKGRENEKTNWFSRFLATIIQIKSYTKTRQRGYELLNLRPTQTLVFVSAFPRPSLFRIRAPLCFVSAPFSVSFSRVSYL